MLRKIILLAAILCVYSQQQQPAGGTGTGTGTGTQGTGTQQGAGGTGTQQGGTGTQQGGTGTQQGGTGAPTQGGQQNGTTTGTQGGQQQGGQQNGTQGAPQNGTQGGQQNGTQGGNGTQPPACGNQTNGTNATNATNSTNSTNQTCQQGNQQGGNQRPPQNQTRPTSGFQEIRPPRNGSGDGSANCTGGQIPIQGNCMSQACGPLSNIVQPDQDKDGTKRVPIRFRANVTLSSGNLLVSIDFPDQQNASVIADQCANTTLTRYSPGFTNGVVVTDPIDKSQYVNGKRIWTFTIANANIKSYLFNDTTNASSVVNGFYGYSITVGTQVVLQYQFNFRLVFDQTGTSLKDVRILDQAPGQTCVSGNCITQAKSQLLWCSDSTCTNTSTTAPSELVVGNSVYVKQIITQTGFTSQKVDNITVVVTGDNVTRTFTVTNLQVYEGYTISEFKLSVIANNVSITLSGNLQPILNTSTTTGTTRFLQSTTTTTSGTTTSTDSMTVQQAQVVATASTGTCIKTTAGGSCPTSDQVSQYNANACGSTSVCSQYSYGAILALALAMIMA